MLARSSTYAYTHTSSLDYNSLVFFMLSSFRPISLFSAVGPLPSFAMRSVFLRNSNNSQPNLHPRLCCRQTMPTTISSSSASPQISPDDFGSFQAAVANSWLGLPSRTCATIPESLQLPTREHSTLFTIFPQNSWPLPPHNWSVPFHGSY